MSYIYGRFVTIIIIAMDYNTSAKCICIYGPKIDIIEWPGRLTICCWTAKCHILRHSWGPWHIHVHSYSRVWFALVYSHWKLLLYSYNYNYKFPLDVRLSTAYIEARGYSYLRAIVYSSCVTIAWGQAACGVCNLLLRVFVVSRLHCNSLIPNLFSDHQ